MKPALRILVLPAFENRDLNPYQYLLYTHLRTMGVQIDHSSLSLLSLHKYSIWHLHWPEFVLSSPNMIVAWIESQTLLRLMDYARLRGVKCVWTVHNIKSHDQLHPTLEAKFWKAFTGRLDGYINLSRTGFEEAQRRFPELRNLPGFVIPHGHYRGEYPDNLDRRSARALLGVDSSMTVVLFFGQIRPYKNVGQLIRAFRTYQDSNALLFVADGVCVRELERTIRDLAAPDRRIHLYLNHVDRNEVQLYFRSADLIILPYREVLHSGTALLALSFDRPILVPLLGALGELQSQVGSNWVRTYTGQLGPKEIESAIQWALHGSRQHTAPLNTFNWSELTRNTLGAYLEIMRRS